MEKIGATKDFLTESILEVITEYSKEAAKNHIKDIATKSSIQLAATVGVDMVGSIIPGIGNAISSYRTQKQLNNLNTLIIELQKNIGEIKSNIEKQTKENKEILDSILEMVIIKVSNTNQSGKIQYMINGFTALTAIEKISYDISYLYYDVLDRMTILDIEILKLSYPFFYSEENNSRSYLDILNDFDIDYYQYNSIRNNLDRMGLLENKYDDTLEKDLDLLVKKVNDVNESVISIQEAFENPKKKIKKLNKNSKVKLKAKDQLKISKFGREFIEFFAENDSEM